MSRSMSLARTKVRESHEIPIDYGIHLYYKTHSFGHLSEGGRADERTNTK